MSVFMCEKMGPDFALASVFTSGGKEQWSAYILSGQYKESTYRQGDRHDQSS